jgi:hypothetical protein
MEAGATLRRPGLFFVRATHCFYRGDACDPVVEQGDL